jgi:putative transposase
LVTAGTYKKQHFFRDAERLTVLQRGLLKLLGEGGWRVEAWAIFSNHYHFIAHSPPNGAENLSAILRELHSRIAIWVNRLEGTPNRTVWHNFWETRLTFQRAYLVRLNYVHQNAVRHGVVAVANQYAWCSAAWLERVASTAQVKSIYGFKIDAVNVHDEFEPLRIGDAQ